ncbi:MAG: hypothetical protein Kow0075_02190 [Salibacteraceae bacterium]
MAQGDRPQPDTMQIAERTLSTKQPQDSAGQKLRSPARAALFSAVLPGLGQVYNKKYWKVPIVYAGLGASAYFILTNRYYFNLFKRYYVVDTNPNDGMKSPYADQGIPPAALRTQAEQYQTWLEYSYMAFAAIYVLQIIDASVDAHLFYFDVSEDLSVNWAPGVYLSPFNPSPTIGLHLTF